jgi:hypothetical protein
VALHHYYSYASRVKHISFTSLPQYPIIDRALTPFPNLKSLVLKGEGCLIQPSILLTPSLEELDIDFRSPKPRKLALDRSYQLAEMFEDAPSLTTSLLSLRIKGCMHPSLTAAITSFQSLRSLVLLTGQSLSAETLAGLSGMANLQNLYVHASHIDSIDFAQAVARQTTQPFRSLRDLRIRAQRSLFRAILDVLPHSTLQSLHLETEEATQGPSAWNSTFNLIVSKATDTLIELTLDQILDPEEMEASLSSSPSDTRIVLDTLQPLSKLAVLRRLTIDAMVLPDFTDRDIDQMSTWWPHLERLDLGALPDVQDHSEPLVPKLTVKALQHLAKRCASLRILTIPLDVASCKAGTVAAQHGEQTQSVVRQSALERLFVGPPPADEDVEPFVRSIVNVFPSLKELEFVSSEHSLWLEVQTMFKDHTLNVEYKKGTSDGCADGQ